MGLEAPVKIGIVGGGLISPNHAQGYLRIPEKAEIHAVCDIDEGICKKRASEWGVKHCYTDYNEMFANSDIQAVDIVLPHHLHLPAVKAAAEAGKHILLEKPIARTTEEADEIIRIVTQMRVRLMVANGHLFIPAVQKACHLIEQDYLGQVLLVKAHSLGWFFYYTSTNYRLSREKMGGGAFIDTGLHFVYLFRNMVGEIARVASFDSDMFNELHDFTPEGETTSVVSLQFVNGALGSLLISYSARLPGWRQFWPVGWDQHLDIYGEQGAIRVDLPNNCVRVFSENKSVPTEVRGWSETPPDDPSHVTSFYREVDHFVDCLISGEEFMVGVRQASAKKDLAVAQAIRRSAETGVIVNLLENGS